MNAMDINELEIQAETYSHSFVFMESYSVM